MEDVPLFGGLARPERSEVRGARRGVAVLDDRLTVPVRFPTEKSEAADRGRDDGVVLFESARGRKRSLSESSSDEDEEEPEAIYYRKVLVARFDSTGDIDIAEYGRTREQVEARDSYPCTIGFFGTPTARRELCKRLRSAPAYTLWPEEEAENVTRYFQSRSGRHAYLDDDALYDRLLEAKASHVSLNLDALAESRFKSDLFATKCKANSVEEVDVERIPLLQNGGRHVKLRAIGTTRKMESIMQMHRDHSMLLSKVKTDPADYKWLLYVLLHDQEIMKREKLLTAEKIAREQHRVLTEFRSKYLSTWTPQGQGLIDIALWYCRATFEDLKIDDVTSHLYKVAQRFCNYEEIISRLCDLAEWKLASLTNLTSLLKCYSRFLEIIALSRQRAEAESITVQRNLDRSTQRVLSRAILCLVKSGHHKAARGILGAYIYSLVSLQSAFAGRVAACTKQDLCLVAKAYLTSKTPRVDEIELVSLLRGIANRRIDLNDQEVSFVKAVKETDEFQQTLAADDEQSKLLFEPSEIFERERMAADREWVSQEANEFAWGPFAELMLSPLSVSEYLLVDKNGVETALADLLHELRRECGQEESTLFPSEGLTKYIQRVAVVLFLSNADSSDILLQLILASASLKLVKRLLTLCGDRLNLWLKVVEALYKQKHLALARKCVLHLLRAHQDEAASVLAVSLKYESRGAVSLAIPLRLAQFPLHEELDHLFDEGRTLTDGERNALSESQAWWKAELLMRSLADQQQRSSRDHFQPVKFLAELEAAAESHSDCDPVRFVCVYLSWVALTINRARVLTDDEVQPLLQDVDRVGPEVEDVLESIVDPTRLTPAAEALILRNLNARAGRSALMQRRLAKVEQRIGKRWRIFSLWRKRHYQLSQPSQLRALTSELELFFGKREDGLPSLAGSAELRLISDLCTSRTFQTEGFVAGLIWPGCAGDLRRIDGSLLCLWRQYLESHHLINESSSKRIILYVKSLLEMITLDKSAVLDAIRTVRQLRQLFPAQKALCEDFCVELLAGAEDRGLRWATRIEALIV